ncbi:MAG: hypothetical protein MZV63_69655 [Marinilabiliales bacterium]|nr:hypothetical protein [Marinilabiliales bacterium]
MLGLTVIVMVVLTVLMLKAGTWKKFMLKTSIDSKVDTVGAEGGKGEGRRQGSDGDTTGSGRQGACQR